MRIKSGFLFAPVGIVLAAVILSGCIGNEVSKIQDKLKKVKTSGQAVAADLKLLKEYEKEELDAMQKMLKARNEVVALVKPGGDFPEEKASEMLTGLNEWEQAVTNQKVNIRKLADDLDTALRALEDVSILANELKLSFAADLEELVKKTAKTKKSLLKLYNLSLSDMERQLENGKKQYSELQKLKTTDPAAYNAAVAEYGRLRQEMIDLTNSYKKTSADAEEEVEKANALVESLKGKLEKLGLQFE